MKSKIILITSLISVGLLTGATSFARGGGGNGGGNGGGRGGNGGGDQVQMRNPNCARDGSGKTTDRGNPNATGTQLKDGSGKATAKGQGPKDGTGPNANCPNK